MKLTEDQERFKADYMASRGYWVPFNDGLLQYAPDFSTKYLAYAGLPAQTGPLSVKDRELIYLAVDTSTTHMFRQGQGIYAGAIEVPEIMAAVGAA